MHEKSVFFGTFDFEGISDGFREGFGRLKTSIFAFFLVDCVANSGLCCESCFPVWFSLAQVIWARVTLNTHTLYYSSITVYPYLN